MIRKLSVFFCGVFMLHLFPANGEELSAAQAIHKAHRYRVHRDSALFYSNQAYDIAKQNHSVVDQWKAMSYVGMAFFHNHRLDTTKIIFKKVISKLGADDFEKGMAHWYLSKLYKRQGQYDSTIMHNVEAVEIFAGLDSALFVSYAYETNGIAHGMQGDYSAALEWFIKSYEYKIANGLEDKAISVLQNIANVYMRQGSYPKAIEYYKKAIALKGGEHAAAYIGMGGVFNLQSMKDSALYYYRKGYAIGVATGNSYQQISGLINICNIYFQNGQHRQAIKYLMRALTLPTYTAKSLSYIYTELGKNYYRLGRADSAEYFLKKGLNKAIQVNNIQTSAEASQFLSSFLAKQRKFEQAYKYAELSLVYADSINTERRNDAITDQRIKLETLKKQHRIESLSKENKINRYKLLLLVLGGGAFTIIGILSFFTFRSRAIVKQRRLEGEKKILRLELDKKQAQLSAHTLHMIHSKNGMEEIERHLETIDGEGKRKIKNVISINKVQEKDWDNFNTYFSDVHAHFFDILKSHHPDLSQGETRLSALIRMNLANHEIATLLNIESKSVKMARYRLKKKLDLDENQDLNSYIQCLESLPKNTDQRAISDVSY